MSAAPYREADLKRGEQIVQELHGLKGYDAWAEHIAKAIATERVRAISEYENGRAQIDAIQGAFPVDLK